MQPQNQDKFAQLKQNKKVLFGIIGGIILLIMLVATIATYSRDPTPGRVLSMQGYLGNLASFAREQNDDVLNDADLVDQNANLAILMSGSANDIGLAAGERWAKAEPDATTGAGLGARLAKLEAGMESAYTTNTVDTEYQRLMVAELETLDGQLAQLARRSGKSVGPVLEDVRQRLIDAKKAMAGVEL